MPHVIVKLWPGKSDQQKVRLAEEITKDVMNVLNCGEEPVSVAMEEVSPKDWSEKVYKPDIMKNAESLYKKPSYTRISRRTHNDLLVERRAAQDCRSR